MVSVEALINGLVFRFISKTTENNKEEGEAAFLQKRLINSLNCISLLTYYKKRCCMSWTVPSDINLFL
ncbi:hypothetical protein CUU64_06470 [Bacillus sp. V5-8f]|nr:hypothetical protein CUU64_06470 [Bacillus sp. V5-8f]